MPILPNHKDCCGCAACVDACGHNVIQLIEDSNGFYFPMVDNKKCVECKLCEKKCHILNQDKLKRAIPSKIIPYAAWSNCESIIKYSASGGIFGQIAFNFINEGNTYVYGAAFAQDGTVRHIEISSISELSKLQGSKYQQSNATGIYQSVRNRLLAGNRVLFSGSPCHIAALKVFLGDRFKTDLLYTIEIICHGVPTNELFRSALKIYKAKTIESYRHKKFGWGAFGNHPTYLLKNGVSFTEKGYMEDYLFRSYLTMNNNRISCSVCRYADIKRVADITIGDFWGLDRSSRKIEYQNSMGTSIVLCNTPKGIDMIENSTNIVYKNVDWEDFLYQNSNLYIPTPSTVYHTGNFVHIIKHLPIKIQRIIFQHGFVRKGLNLLYWRLWKIFRFKKMRKDRIHKEKKYQETLNEIYNG